MRTLGLFVSAAILLSCAAHGASRPDAIASDDPPALQLPEGVRPLHYAIGLEVVPARATFRGASEIAIELSAPRDFIWMHGRDLRVVSATIESGRGGALPAKYSQVNDDGVVRLSFPKPIGPGRATLRFEWEARWNDGLVGLYLARSGEARYAATQLEAHEARRVFPSFDEPRFKTPFDLTLTVPTDAVAVSNMPEIAAEPGGAGLRRVRFATTEPLPTYLIFVGVGPFDVVTAPALPPNEIRARPLPMRGFAPRGHGSELAFALEVAASVVPSFERYFGIPFPYAKLDHVALPEFAWGAMENAGAIAYRDTFLLASDATSEDRRRSIAITVAHEISHHWFGDLVTLPWWTDAWLNESFATWVGERVVARWRPEWGVELLSMRTADAVMAEDSVAASRPIRQPLRSMAEVQGQFDGMSYEKGAAVLASFEALLGEEAFRDGVRAYLGAHRHGTGTTESLYAALSRAAGRDLAPAFRSFTDAPGVPLVSARVECDAGGARVALAQSRWLPRGSEASQDRVWQVPFCARWEAGGRILGGCMLLDRRDGVLPLGSECPAWLIPRADANSYYRWTLPAADLRRLRDAAPRLGAADKVSLLRNVRGAQQAGAVAWPAGMDVIAALSADPDPEIAAEAIPLVALAHESLVPAVARPAVARWARERYRPVLDRLGWQPRRGETAADKRLRAAVVALLALRVEDAEVLGEAARRGAAFAGLDGAAPRRDVVDAELADVVVAAALRERGEAASELVLKALAHTEDASLRAVLTFALATAGTSAGGVPLWRRPELRPHEVLAVFFRMTTREAGRQAVLAALEADAGQVLRSMPSIALTYFPLALSSACDRGSAERLRRALSTQLDAFPEMRQALSATAERIRICAAEREADGAAAGAFFTAHAPPPATARLR